MDGNGDRRQGTPLPPEIVLTPHLNNESPLPASCQTIAHPGNGSGLTSIRQGPDYSLSNIRPPVDMGGNGAYGENEAKADEKYGDPPSYEEAIRFMSYLPPDDGNYLRSHQIDHGQFALSEPYFNQRSYEEPEADTDLAKSAVSKIVGASGSVMINQCKQTNSDMKVINYPAANGIPLD